MSHDLNDIRMMQATVTNSLAALKTFMQAALQKDLTQLTQEELLRAYASITDMIETFDPMLLKYPEGQEYLGLMKTHQVVIEGHLQARRQ